MQLCGLNWFFHLVRTSLSCQLIAKSKHVLSLFLASSSLGERLCCNFKPLLASHLISQAREPSRWVLFSVENVQESLVAANRARTQFNPIKGFAQWACLTHCGQKPLLYLFLLAKNQFSEKWNFASSDCPENQQKINEEIV